MINGADGISEIIFINFGKFKMRFCRFRTNQKEFFKCIDCVGIFLLVLACFPLLIQSMGFLFAHIILTGAEEAYARQAHSNCNSFQQTHLH